MKKNFLAIATFLVASSLTFTSCNLDNDKDNDNDNQIEEVSASNIIEVSKNISADTEWKKDTIYVLTSRITVESGATLTIDPGTVIKGKSGTGVNATALLIARGAKIIAEGTVDEPIIFTAESDQIESGEIVSPNLPSNLNGLWGGLIVLGYAPISADDASVQIEGIPVSDKNGLFGGDKEEDNSGIIKYVSVRHGGANIGDANEINGITFGGVGSGTVVENIEVVANQDDGVEFFGGSVSVKNVLVWNNGDDALDTDMAWSGTVDNFVIINPGDEALELDGGEGLFNKEQTFVNGTVYAQQAEGLVDIDSTASGDVGNTWVNISKVYFTDLQGSGQDFDDLNDIMTVADLEFTYPLEGAGTKEDYFAKGSDEFVTDVEEGKATVGADLEKFTNWSWAAVEGVLK
ncbi:MAG: hypothetical protein CMP61_09615 [Flavobacteriales bacterium]|nr:hypothetical protein [Flavobacteriales bacterium]|tara:strand:+ start:36553 stop:37767 length:1215 start_codon:yes stop_codon:yes gene_type:complete